MWMRLSRVLFTKSSGLLGPLRMVYAPLQDRTSQGFRQKPISCAKSNPDTAIWSSQTRQFRQAVEVAQADRGKPTVNSESPQSSVPNKSFKDELTNSLAGLSGKQRSAIARIFVIALDHSIGKIDVEKDS